MIDFTKLDPLFASKAQELVQSIRDKGYKICPYSGVRTVQEQAILWRQSRPTLIIDQQIALFRENNCNFLADVLHNVGPHYGKWATNALPGYSWHNWSQAMDCLIVEDPANQEEDPANEYEIYADTAIEFGLTAGYYFRHFDGGHVQLNNKEIPELYTMKEINDHFNGLSILE